jgi:hypothetical protein
MNGKLKEAIELGIECLRVEGEDLPLEPTDEQVSQILTQVENELLTRNTPEVIISLPDNTGSTKVEKRRQEKGRTAKEKRSEYRQDEGKEKVDRSVFLLLFLSQIERCLAEMTAPAFFVSQNLCAVVSATGALAAVRKEKRKRRDRGERKIEEEKAKTEEDR